MLSSVYSPLSSKIAGILKLRIFIQLYIYSHSVNNNILYWFACVHIMYGCMLICNLSFSPSVMFLRFMYVDKCGIWLLLTDGLVFHFYSKFKKKSILLVFGLFFSLCSWCLWCVVFTFRSLIPIFDLDFCILRRPSLPQVHKYIFSCISFNFHF